MPVEAELNPSAARASLGILVFKNEASSLPQLANSRRALCSKQPDGEIRKMEGQLGWWEVCSGEEKPPMITMDGWMLPNPSQPQCCFASSSSAASDQRPGTVAIRRRVSLGRRRGAGRECPS